MALREVQLDFLHPTGRGSRLGALLLVAGALCVLGTLGYQHEMARRVSARQSQLEQMRGMASRSMPSLVERDADTPELREQIKKANAVLLQMNVPWGELFAAIESAEDSSIALFVVQSDLCSRSLAVSGEARTIPALLGYMGRLERTGRLRDVILASHELKTKDIGQPVSFTIEAGWQEPK